MSAIQATPQVYRTPARKGKWRHRLGSAFIVGVLVLILIWTLFPFYWAFINSIKDPADNYGNHWLPWVSFQPTLKPWRDLWGFREIRDAMVNSALISLGAATIAVVLGTMAAYGIARFRFDRPKNGSLTTWFLSQRVLPPVIFVTPFFLIMRELHLLDTIWGADFDQRDIQSCVPSDHLDPDVPRGAN